jgi:hypothetical protein
VAKINVAPDGEVFWVEIVEADSVRLGIVGVSRGANP